MPLQQRHVQCLRDLFGQHGFAGTGLTLDQQRPLQGDCGVDGKHQVLGRDVIFGAVKFHGCD